jgi:hypothetical protein
MVLSPDVQKKAQDEIDRITAGNRLPTFADKSSCLTSRVSFGSAYGGILPRLWVGALYHRR